MEDAMKPSDLTTLTTRYRKYLRTFGIVNADDRVAELYDLDLGQVRFFAYVDGGGLRLKAAITPNGMVTPGGDVDDDWYGFLCEISDPTTAMERIAWLETDASTTAQSLPKMPSMALLPDRRPMIGIDPAQWELVTAPVLLKDSGDGITLIGWILPSGVRIPERWTIIARNGVTTSIERTSASELVERKAGSAEFARANAHVRAKQLLLAGTDDERTWSLQHIADTGYLAALPDILAVLANPAASATVRLHASGTLASLADPLSVTQLGASLCTDDAPEVRRSCAQSLGRIGGASAIQMLAKAVTGEPDMIVRAEIVQALVVQGMAARPALAEIARNDPDRKIRELAQGGADSMR